MRLLALATGREASRPAWLLATTLAFLVPAAARGHEVLHEIDRGRAVAVKAFFADGELLADRPYEIFSPADPARPYQRGRTDRGGWLSFVPDAPGRWRVKVVDHAGHGLDVEVEATVGAAAAAAAPAGGTAPPSTAAFALRPLVGAGAVAAVFALLFVAYRRKGTRP